MLNTAREALRAHSNDAHAKALQRFFKTAPGEYGEGDRFLGVRVPDVRRVARTVRRLDMPGILALLQSEIHEERLLALIILTEKFRKASMDGQMQIYEIYLDNTRYINNWDLVDTSAEHIIGAYLSNKPRTPLYALARADCLWERRIAVMATFHFIKNGEFGETLKISEMLVSDAEDLIHKAVGWMLREVGKRDLGTEEKFLKQHYGLMPRTMLRYAIERFPESVRLQYLEGTIIPSDYSNGCPP